MTELEAAYERKLEQYADEHEDAFEDEDFTPDITAGGLMPPPAELAASYAHYKLALPPKILAAYKKCKSVLTIDRPGDLEAGSSRLLVSTLRFLLTRAGEGALLYQNDVPLVPAEEILAKIQKKKGLPGFDDEPAGAKKAKAEAKPTTKTREARPGEVRAVRVAQGLEALMNDPELALDLRAELLQAPKLAQKYAALVMEEGAMSDAKAAKTLGASVEDLTEAADELDHILADLRE